MKIVALSPVSLTFSSRKKPCGLLPLNAAESADLSTGTVFESLVCAPGFPLLKGKFPQPGCPLSQPPM